MMDRGEVPSILTLKKAYKGDTYEQDCRTDLKVRAVVVDHALEDLGM
jgi:hypothetical protein